MKALEAAIRSLVITAAGALAGIVATPDGLALLLKHPTLALAVVVPPIIRGILAAKGGDTQMGTLGQQLVQAVIALLTGQPATVTATETVTIPKEVPVLGGRTITTTETLNAKLN